jgi:TonB family protein
MSSQIVWSNLVAYSLQIGLLVGLAAFVPTALRLRLPRARLLYWQILLAACLLLPAVRPWRRALVAGDVEVTTRVLSTGPADPGQGREIPLSEIALALIAAGVVSRLAWLGLGLWRLRRYRRHSLPLDVPNECATLLSEEVASPVTFGLRNPVILLPARFPSLDPRMQEAILCHELLHVKRRDWLFTFIEELVRAVFWFHPAIWWLLGEIQLSREQAVDREVVERTRSREEYVDALLAIAGAGPQLDLAPAPLFLRKRHLKYRVVSILKEVSMSKTRLFTGLAASLGILMAACWFVTGTFPLAAAPQVVNDAPGISVEAGGALLHRAPVAYPEAARRAGVQGTVSLEAVLDAQGNVTEARVVSGPQELRSAAQQSVLQWHFKNDVAGATRAVSVTFQARVPMATDRLAAGGPASPVGIAGRTVKSIHVVGLSDATTSELLSRLPVREGDTLADDSLAKLTAAVHQFDEHLKVTTAMVLPTEQAFTIAAPNAQSDSPSRIRIGGNVQQTKLIRQPHPIYPPDAKAARVQGKVALQAVIGADGAVKQLEVLSGDPLLVPSALDAVKNWVYQPTLLNGNPVEVLTQIDVNYTLTQ